MLLRHLVVSLIFALTFTTSSQAYVRSGDSIYFLTTDGRILPYYCFYELKNAPREDVKAYDSKLSEGEYGNLLYASYARIGQKYEELLKIANDGAPPRSVIKKGNKQDYKNAAQARRAGDQYQIAAFEELDAQGVPFTLKAVDELAEQKAPKLKIDLSQARTPYAHSDGKAYYFGKYVLVGAIERYSNVDEKPSYAAAYQLLVDDLKYRRKTKDLMKQLTRLGETIRADSARMAKASYFNKITDQNELEKHQTQRSEVQKKLEGRKPSLSSSGTIQPEHVRDMIARFTKFQEPVSDLYQCPVVPVLD